MPSGAVHYVYWKLGWMIAIPSAIIMIKQNTMIGVGILAGYFLGRYFDPDLDLLGITAAEGRLMKDFSILGVFVVAYFLPYGWFFRKHHRSFWTHFPLVSGFIRMLYMLPPVLYLLARFGLWERWMLPFAFGIWIGLSVNDALHWSADTFVGEPELEKEFERFKQRTANFWE